MSITQQAKELYGAYSSGAKKQSQEKKAEPLVQEPPKVAVIEDKKPLLFIDVDIGDNEQDRITVFEGDDPHVLAVGFCQKHQIEDKDIQMVLEQQLIEKINKINQQMTQLEESQKAQNQLQTLKQRQSKPSSISKHPQEIIVQDMTTPEPQMMDPTKMMMSRAEKNREQFTTENTYGSAFKDLVDQE